MRKIFIIIINYHGDEMVAQLKQSLHEEEKSLSGIKIEIIIIDNNKKNIGFAAGCNKGIRLALKHGADAVLLMNQDIEIKKGFIKPILNNSADIISPIIKFKRGDEWVYDCGGKINWWWGRTKHVELRIMNYELRIKKKIDYVSGCCMLIKREVFEKIGLFDERYFMYFEDVDFCLRAKNAGFQIAVEPKSVVIHNIAEGRKKSLRQHLIHLKSNFIFINKWLPFYKRLPAYIYCLFLLIKVGFSFLVILRPVCRQGRFDRRIHVLI